MIGYQGRWWDAPATDDAELMPVQGNCTMCQEPILPTDDALVSSVRQVFHTECFLRGILGDVAHLERRCICYGGGSHDHEGTFREQSRRVVDWMIEHDMGRWR